MRTAKCCIINMPPLACSVLEEEGSESMELNSDRSLRVELDTESIDLILEPKPDVTESEALSEIQYINI